MLSAILTVFVLASCGANKKDEKIEPSATQSSSTKEEQKETSTKSESQTSTSSSMATPSTTMETKSETGKDLYKEVIERYNHYQALLSSGDRESLYEKLKQNKIFSEEYGYIFTLSTYDKPASLHYVYADLNNDGQDELIIGDKKYIGAIYYLENRKPKLLHTAYVASAGGFRSSLVVYENGQVRYADWQSTRPEMNLSLYAFDKDGVQKVQEGIFQIGSDQKPEQILEISSNELDLAKFDWKEFEPVNQYLMKFKIKLDSKVTKQQYTKTKDKNSLVFCLLEKRIKGLFVGDSRSWTMSWIDIVVWQGEELGLDTMEQLICTTSWKICSSDCFTEQGISCQNQVSIRKDDRNTADRVTWCWQDSETKFLQLVFFVKDKSVFCRFCDHICHIIVTRETRQIIDRSIEPAGFALCDIDRRITKSFANQVQTHDMVIMGVGKENSADRFVDVLYCLTNDFPMAPGIDNDEVFFTFQVIGIFIGNRIHGFVYFHISSNLKECTKISIAQLGRIKWIENPSLLKNVTCYLLHSVQTIGNYFIARNQLEFLKISQRF